MSTTTDPAPAHAPVVKPAVACDVVMKGGITSGVIYPKALRLLGTHYRLQNLGGASAGAIGAALGAAAEFGRANGGFDKLDGLPEQLADGKLADLFQPQPGTRPLLGLMLTAAGADGRKAVKGFRKVLRVILALIASFPVAGLIGVLPGVACIVIAVAKRGVAGWFLLVAGLVVAAVGWSAAVVFRLYRLFTVEVPANHFGICSGLSTAANSPGFTDWLATQIDVIAGLQAVGAAPGPPLTFGQLWNAGGEPATVERDIDLRLITTCLNEGKPYQMPFSGELLFFKRSDWERLFPRNVIDALTSAPAAHPPSDWSDQYDATKKMKRWSWETRQAAVNGLLRLPIPAELPVIVAARMSLSFPLLISAVPLFTINRRDPDNQEAARNFDDGDTAAALKFSQVWFTDGGFCSNFPVGLFDSALPSNPSFAINLGTFPHGTGPHPDDPSKDVEWATSNVRLPPQFSEIPVSGAAAIVDFAGAAFNTARNWHDTAYLDQAGHHDRIVRVDQTKLEGGLNLHMDRQAIRELARRGEAAGQVMYDQFNEVNYSNGGTGWDNHRWVRYRALLSALPNWIESFKEGYAVLNMEPHAAPSYMFANKQCAALAAELAGHLSAMAASIDHARARDKEMHTTVVEQLTSQPNPPSQLRRIPGI